ncbi:hypothetical protein [Thermacetogenium phaeum]|nr:hypothetical protein [Thermacetogenium phaeum]
MKLLAYKQMKSANMLFVAAFYNGHRHKPMLAHALLGLSKL